MIEGTDRRRVAHDNRHHQIPSLSRAATSSKKPSTVGQYAGIFRFLSSCSNSDRLKPASFAAGQSASLFASKSRQANSTTASRSVKPAAFSVSSEITTGIEVPLTSIHVLFVKLSSCSWNSSESRRRPGSSADFRSSQLPFGFVFVERSAQERDERRHLAVSALRAEQLSVG